MKDKVIDALLCDVQTAQQVAGIVNGLALAQIVCRRHLHDAFDENCTNALLGVMEEIADTIDHVREEYLNETK